MKFKKTSRFITSQEVRIIGSEWSDGRFQKEVQNALKKIKTKKACVVVLIYPSVCGGSQHCYNPGRAIPNLITVNSRRAHKCIHFNPEEDSPVSKSVSPRIVSSLNDRNPFVREGGDDDSLFFLALGTAYLLSSS